MPAFGFKSQFVPLVERGEKTRTIRASRPRNGAYAYLYSGWRTKECRLIAVRTIVSVKHVEIGRNGCGEPYVTIDNRDTLVHEDLRKFAHADGFRSVPEFMAFFEPRGLPFRGYLIEWS